MPVVIAAMAGAVVTLASHPFTYVKTLIQLGYEPLPPTLKNDMFFRKRLLYPGVFEYMSHIRNQDGFAGLYRGVVPRLCATTTWTIAHGMLEQTPTDDDDVEKEQGFRAVVTSVTKKSISSCTAIALSHPFQVIAIRMMASHIGDDPIYSTMRGAVMQTYNDEGILGFFAGLLPRLAHEMAVLWMAEMLAYLINTYVITEKSRRVFLTVMDWTLTPVLGSTANYTQVRQNAERGELRGLKSYVPMGTRYISQNTCYPISLVSIVMTCNGASMMGGRPPFVSHYDNWYSCFQDLKCKGVAKRGAGIMFRPAIFPRTPPPYISEVLPDSPKID